MNYWLIELYELRDWFFCSALRWRRKIDDDDNNNNQNIICSVYLFVEHQTTWEHYSIEVIHFFQSTLPYRSVYSFAPRSSLSLPFPSSTYFFSRISLSIRMITFLLTHSPISTITLICKLFVRLNNDIAFSSFLFALLGYYSNKILMISRKILTTIWTQEISFWHAFVLLEALPAKFMTTDCLNLKWLFQTDWACRFRQTDFILFLFLHLKHTASLRTWKYPLSPPKLEAVRVFSSFSHHLFPNHQVRVSSTPNHKSMDEWGYQMNAHSAVQQRFNLHAKLFPRAGTVTLSFRGLPVSHVRTNVREIACDSGP